MKSVSWSDTHASSLGLMWWKSITTRGNEDVWQVSSSVQFKALPILLVKNFLLSSATKIFLEFYEQVSSPQGRTYTQTWVWSGKVCLRSPWMFHNRGASESVKKSFSDIKVASNIYSIAEEHRINFFYVLLSYTLTIWVLEAESECTSISTRFQTLHPLFPCTETK